MIVSFDIDGVMADSVWVGQEQWDNGGREHFYSTIVDMKPRFPELIPYINRLNRHHVVQLNSARDPRSGKDTRAWAERVGINPTIRVNCLGNAKLSYLQKLQPVLHFDDHPGFTEAPGYVRVWHPTWDKSFRGIVANESLGIDMVRTANEIIERIANEKQKRYGCYHRRTKRGGSGPKGYVRDLG
jgi:hypothetical protein